jgi:hypothetical protein
MTRRRWLMLLTSVAFCVAAVGGNPARITQHPWAAVDAQVASASPKGLRAPAKCTDPAPPVTAASGANTQDASAGQRQANPLRAAVPFPTPTPGPGHCPCDTFFSDPHRSLIACPALCFHGSLGLGFACLSHQMMEDPMHEPRVLLTPAPAPSSGDKL